MSNDPIIQEAKNLVEKLYSGILQDLDWMITSPRSNEMEKQIAGENACTVRESAEIIQKLVTEVERLRLCIRHYDNGMLSKKDLVRATKTWNGDE